MDEAYELALAREGESAAAYSEDQWIAWEEALALAPDLETKKRLVHGHFGASMPDFEFRAALCTLLEIQELLASGSREAVERADAMMMKEKNAIVESERELDNKGFWRKSKRITHRRTVLELEIATRLGKAATVIQECSRAVADAVGLSLHDSAPTNLDVEVKTEALRKFALSEEDISTESNVVTSLRLAQYHKDKQSFQLAISNDLRNMQLYPRELMFTHIARDMFSRTANQSSLPTNLTTIAGKKLKEVNASSSFSAEQLWWTLELFLEEFAFEFAGLNGYLEVIVEDLKRPNGADVFGSRNAHSKLSFSQLQALIEQEPTLFRGDVAFMMRYIYFMQAESQSARAAVLDDRDCITNRSKLAALDEYFSALSQFGVEANTIRVWVLHEQLRLLQHSDVQKLEEKFLEYLAYPRFGSDIVNPAYVNKATANELVVFSGPNYSFLNSSLPQPTTSLRVDRVSVILGGSSIGANEDNALIKSVLFILWAGDQLTHDGEVQLRKLLKDSFVDSFKAECMVLSGRGDVSEWKEKLPNKGTELSQWSAKTEISFCESNALYFGPEDEMSFHVNVRNVKTLTVQVYEVRTIDYYVKMRSEAQGDICLDGLLPNEEQRIDLSHLKPWQIARVNVKAAPEARGRRGVFVVEVFEKDTTCRAILRKGYLRHVQRVTSRGIEFTVLNEQGEPLNDASLMVMNLKGGSSKAQPPRTFSSTDGSGTIVMPFREPGESSSDKFGIIFCYGDFGHLHRPFDYTETTYSLTAQMHIDSEQLRPGEEVRLFVRPLLTVGSYQISASLLVAVKATIKFSSVNTESSGGVGQCVLQSFDSCQELSAGDCVFTIPLDADGFVVEISGCVRNLNSNSINTEGLPKVHSSKTFVVQRVTQYEATFTPHLRRRERDAARNGSPHYEYFVAVLGHNGEPIEGKEMNIMIQHCHFKNSFTHNLCSDRNGEIKLGELNFVEEVRASFSGAHSGPNDWRWELPNLRTHQRQITNSCVGETISVQTPLAYSSYIEEWIALGLMTLCRIPELSSTSDEPILEVIAGMTALECVKNPRGEVVGVKFQLTQGGNYILFVRPLEIKHPITIYEHKRSIDLLVRQRKILVATTSSPLTITNHFVEHSSVDKKTFLNVQLVHASTDTTRVWIFLKRFLDMSHSKLSAVVDNAHLNSGDQAFDSTIIENEYLKKRKISDEFTYILQRRAFVKSHPNSLQLLGLSSLSKPTLIQTPRVVDASDMEEVIMRAGEKVSGFKSSGNRLGSAGPEMARMRSFRSGAGISTHASCSISFLRNPSGVIACSSINDHGVARMCLSNFPIFSEEYGDLELVVLAFDSASDQVASYEAHINCEGSSTCKQDNRDIRLSDEEALDVNTPSTQLQKDEVLLGGESRTLPRTFSSKYALYESLASAMDLWATLCTDPNIPGLVEKLKKWSAMKASQKVVFYAKNASDDLNFFIYHKDPEFFSSFVKPFITAKVSKSLIDLYVLEDTATLKLRYSHPGTLQQLSLIEKLFVAKRCDSVDDTRAMCQHVVDLIDGACDADTAVGHQLAHIFDTVLSQGAIKPEPAESTSNEVNSVGGLPPASAPTGASGFGFSNTLMSDRISLTESAVAFAAPSSRTRRSVAPMSATFGGMAPSPGVYASYQPTSAPMMMKKTVNQIHSSESCDDDDHEGEDSDSEFDFGVESLDSDNESSEDGDKNESEGDPDYEKKERRAEATRRQAKPYLLPGKVRRVQEKRYFTDQKPHLDGRNMFWRDYATYLIQRATTGEDLQTRPFLSSHFPEALRSFTEGIFALSLLNLAMDEVAPTSVRQLAGGLRVELNAHSDVILYHQGIGPAPVCKEPNSVLIMKQRLLAQSDLASASSRDFVDIRPAREFVVNRIYSCVVSVCNIGSTRLQNVNLLRQIPRGAIPLTSTGFYTKNEVIEIAPHDTNMYTCDFYFPHVGSFIQYPAHASQNGEVISWASADDELVKPITVVLKATAVDLTSWNDVAARGSLDDVIAFMSTKRSVVSLGLESLAWRCREEAFYRGLVSYLRQRWVFVESTWKYAFLHSDFDSIRELCSAKKDFVRSLGSGFSTSIVELSDIYYQERFDSSFGFDHTEFGPLLARRAHRVAGKVDPSSSHSFGRSSEITASDNEPPRILHKKAREYYRTLCQILILRPSISTDQLIVVTYFLILFNRVSDALKVFDRVRALEADAMRVSNEYSVAADYIDSYLDFFRPRTEGDAFPVARRNAAKYKKLANDRWRERFVRVQELLDEYDDLQAAAKQAQTDARSSPSKQEPLQRVPDDGEVRLKAEVKADEIHFTSQHLGACEVSFYRIDVELMFSTEPFDSFSASAASRSSLLLIQPWKQMRVDLLDDPSADGRAVTTKVVRLAPDLAACPMLLRIREVESTRTVETIAEPIDLTRSYFNSRLQVVVIKQAGLIQVLHNGLPVPSCYIKAYAKLSGGSGRSGRTQFYKDGYTDVIGKFDYAAINGDLLSRVEKFSLLVSHPTLGTTVEQVSPPVLAVASSEFEHRQANEALWF